MIFKTKTLDDHLSTKGNNFTLIRLILAWLVLYGHSYAIAPVPGFKDPISFFIWSSWIGAIAVNSFFAISGLLIAKSYIDNGIISYTVSRVLRIMPALIVCVLVCIFIFGAAFTSLPLTEYFSHPKTWSYLNNATLPVGVQWFLPEVFTEHPNTAVNGSLWTLSVEVRCYVLCAVLGACGVFRNKYITLAIAALLVCISFIDWSLVPFIGKKEPWLRPCSYFLVGAVAYQWRKYIPMHFALCLLSIVIFLMARRTEPFEYVILIPLSYTIYYAAFGLPHFDLDRRLGDISYGVYIYAFPVQQMIKALFPEAGTTFNWVVSTPIVFLLAYASWKLIEKPALVLKKPTMSFIQIIISHFQSRLPSSKGFGKILKKAVSVNRE